MKRILVAAMVVVGACASFAQDQWGLWDADRSWIGFVSNQAVTNYYSVWTGATGNIQSQNLGAISNGLNLLSYDVKTWKGGSGDVTGGSLYWTVYSGSRPTNISYSSIALNWISDSGGGNQVWGFSGSTTDVAVGLAGGTYTLEFYVDVTGANPAHQYDNNNGAPANYTANFVVVPEPSTVGLVMAGLAVGGMMRLRRRQRR